MILGNLNDDAELKAIQDEWLEQSKMLQSRKEFLEKQLEDYNEDAEKLHVSYWNKVEQHFEAKGRFPSWYKKEKYSIQRDDDDGCFLLIKKPSGGSLGEILAEAFVESVMEDKKKNKPIGAPLRGKIIEVRKEIKKSLDDKDKRD